MRALAAAAAVLGLAAWSLPSHALDSAGLVISVRLGPDQSIRDVAQQHLGDADLWPEILKASGVATVTELGPGRLLQVPVGEISSANTELAKSLQQIEVANAAGAQLFAPDEIGQAIDLHDEALQQRVARQWAPTRELAEGSYGKATLALQVAESKRGEMAEALLSDRQGNVEGEKPSDVSWNDLTLRSILTEEEKVRTLSDSTAQMTFRDASRLRLGANSNAIIEHMRVDALTQHEEAKVSLVEGDFYALVANESSRKTFDVEVPNVKASVQSGDFWVSSDQSGAKFTNYDDRPVAVAARGETMTLGRNEGTVVEPGRQPKTKQELLAEPALASPPDDRLVYGTDVDFAWAEVAEAEGYWLELATDQTFDHMVTSKFGLDEASFKSEGLKPGSYFWRVSALDKFGLPGPRSAPFRFTLRIANTPPFLEVDAPKDKAITRQAMVDVNGTTEAGASVTVNAGSTSVGADGRFSAVVAVAPGASAITVVSTDPAGNATRLVRSVVYMPDQAMGITFDEAIPRSAADHFLASGSILSLGGTTVANAAVTISGPDGKSRAAAASDAAGRFRLDLPLVADEESFDIAAATASGFVTHGRFSVTIDHAAPVITLEEELPRLTATEWLTLRGRLNKPATLTLNGQPVTLKDGTFDELLTLQDGDNLVELVATDAAGHVTVDKASVRLARDPPQLVSSSISVDASGGSGVVAVEVAAADAAGLAGSAKVTVLAGGASYEGYLRLNGATNSYQGSVSVPKAALKQARLGSVELTDSAGNTKTYRLN